MENIVQGYFQYLETALEIKLTDNARNIIRQEVMNAWAMNNIYFMQTVNYAVSVLLPQLIYANPAALNYWRAMNQPQIVAILRNSYDPMSRALLELYNQRFGCPRQEQGVQQPSFPNQARAVVADSRPKTQINQEDDEKVVQKIADDMINSPGTFDKNRLGQLTPSQADQLIKKLRELGADQGSKTLDIASYYREGTQKYQLKWPSKFNATSFESLDRKTQFFVLFTEWSEREVDGMQILDAGKLEEAMKIFEECLERAEQLDVGELRARSYEDIMRVAQVKGDRQAELKWLEKAAAARSQ